MCGIVGMWQAEGARGDPPAVLRAMADAICHRGPDDAGVWFDAPTGIGLASRRLAIVDLSPEGHQPMVSASGDLVIAFNGEIYNHRAMRRELAALGAGRAPAFRGHSDTEVLLAAIEHWGLDGALQRTVGMYAFALWDRRRRVLRLVRDRIGEKPLYYGWFGETLLFGSELKALRVHPAFAGTVDRDALTRYLRYGYLPGPHSIYRGIAKLPPASVLTIDSASGPDRDRPPVAYWSARRVAEAGAAAPFAGSATEAVDHLDALVRDAVGQQMVADVPVGAFLSGGIDSSTIVAVMQAQSTRPVRSFTIGFCEADFNEAGDAKAVANYLTTDHTELYVGPSEAMAVIPDLSTLYDEPFADPSQIPTLLVARLARQQVTVALSGDGGDELFGGYSRHLWAERLWRSVERTPAAARTVAATALAALSPRQWDRLFAAVSPVVPARLRQRQPGDKLHKLARSLPARHPDALYRLLVSHWDDPAALVIDGREPVSFLNDDAAPNLADVAHAIMYRDLVGYLPDDILVKLDRATMGVSLEARVPFLDHRVVEFAWQLPAAMKIGDGQGKRPLRRVLDRYVPRALVERPKSGFSVPIGDWLRGPLRPWAEHLLDPSRMRAEGFFHPAPIRARWRAHLAGERDWQASLWTVLMFQAWLETQHERRPQ